MRPAATASTLADRMTPSISRKRKNPPRAHFGTVPKCMIHGRPGVSSLRDYNYREISLLHDFPRARLGAAPNAREARALSASGHSTNWRMMRAELDLTGTPVNRGRVPVHAGII